MAHPLHRLDGAVEPPGGDVGFVELITVRHTFAVALQGLGWPLHLEDAASLGEAYPIGERVALVCAPRHVRPAAEQVHELMDVEVGVGFKQSTLTTTLPVFM